MRRALLILIPILIISCVFNDEEGKPRAEKLAHPDIILENAVYQLSQGSGNPIVLDGEKITFYNDDHRAVLENFSFLQKDSNGEIRIEGHADKGLVNTENETLELEGNVLISENSEKLVINADQVFLDIKNKEITASGPVTVSSEAGSFYGSGFSGDLKTKKYLFSEIERGELVL